MLNPIIVSSVFVLGVVILCFVKPNVGRIFLGFFFLIMALGVNGSFTFSNPQAYIEYAKSALIPLYRDLALGVIAVLGPTLFGMLLMLFEISMGVMLLHKKKFVKLGLIGTMILIIGIAPLAVVQLPWVGLVIGEAYLLTKKFDHHFLDILRLKIQ